MTDPPLPHVRTPRPRSPGPWARLGATALLAAPFPALLWVGGYARTGPWLLGFPYFYWYQLLWVFLSSGMTWCAYLLMTRTGRSPDHTPGAYGGPDEDRRYGGYGTSSGRSQNPEDRGYGGYAGRGGRGDFGEYGFGDHGEHRERFR